MQAFGGFMYGDHQTATVFFFHCRSPLSISGLSMRSPVPLRHTSALPVANFRKATLALQGHESRPLEQDYNLVTALMLCPYALDLALATSSQLSGPFDSMSCSTQRNDTLMCRGIRDATRILTGDLGKLNTLALSLSASLIVITCHLQGKFK